MTSDHRFMRWAAFYVVAFSVGSSPRPTRSQELPRVDQVERQPLAAQARRVAEALEYLGAPLPAEERRRLDEALAEESDSAATQKLQQVLDKLCLVGIQINPESRVKAVPGPARPTLVQNGWTFFLVKVHNEAGVTAPLRVTSPNSRPVYQPSTNVPDPKRTVAAADVKDRWLELRSFDDRPLNRTLSGLGLEYRILQLASRDSGSREAKLSFDVGQGTQDLGFRSDLDLLFQARPAVTVTLGVKDVDGSPTMASFEIRDRQGRVYPAQGRRLAPDFFFHPQIYRGEGESVLLPPGEYQVTWSRGPEYVPQSRSITVPEGISAHRENFELKRWIHMAGRGWYSGDHHVHAAGCAHYESPTEGVSPEDMMRQILGEDLDVGCVLSWGPCWYAQKKYFDGKLHPLSTPSNLMRYDVEVSGFPSSHSGHLCLLRLNEDDFPGTTRIEEWPSWDLPVLQWGQKQGAVVGFSHSGWGLETMDESIPTKEIPPYDGIGANEYIVDVVHGAVDFISTVDTPAPWELSIWYHTLNCGYRCRVSGETDFPCIYGERVGLGRSYVKLDTGKLDYDTWVQGVKDGRSYVSDGLSHLFDFQVDQLAVGESGSELALASPGTVKVRAQIAAYLEPAPSDQGRRIRRRPLSQKPYWHLERARIGDTRTVPVEVIVNGAVVRTLTYEADGEVRPLEVDLPIERSSWVAIRILPSSHTNPIFLTVGGKPIRASKASVEWCLKSVDQCWSQKEPQIRASEKAAAKQAFDRAREAYSKILAESEDAP